VYAIVPNATTRLCLLPVSTLWPSSHSGRGRAHLQGNGPRNPRKGAARAGDFDRVISRVAAPTSIAREAHKTEFDAWAEGEKISRAAFLGLSGWDDQRVRSPAQACCPRARGAAAKSGEPGT
jgi:hypothetical protein